jgi:hypothetical protein
MEPREFCPGDGLTSSEEDLGARLPFTSGTRARDRACSRFKHLNVRATTSLKGTAESTLLLSHCYPFINKHMQVYKLKFSAP